MLPGTFPGVCKHPVTGVGECLGVLVCGDGAGVGVRVCVGFWVGECGARCDCECAPGCDFAEEVAEFKAVYVISII